MIVFEKVRGGYVHLVLSGRPHRLYYEESGEGIPLLCLHTAGADTRQFRGILNDPQVTRNFRVIAFDLPWHGKSSPPEGWQEEEYRLSCAGYLDAIDTFSNALSLDRPVILGCSIGGRAALHLALRQPERYAALIGLESSAHADPYYDSNWVHRSDVHGGEACAAIVSGAIGPDVPSRDRWETLWHYMQSGPGVFRGDLNFYRTDSDVRARLGEIDVSRCPIYLLTGNYDYSASPADTRVIVDAVPGIRFTEMKGLGHFPMSEDPQRFVSEYLLPVLDDLRKRNAVAR